MTTSFQAALGIVLFMALVLPFSKDPRRISLRLVLVAIALQFLLCWLMLKAPLVKEALLQLNLAVSALGAATMRGSSFVFGYLGGGQTPFSVSNPNSLVVFAFQVLPLLIVMSAISALLWYWRILPVLIRSIALIFERTLGVRGPAGLVSTALQTAPRIYESTMDAITRGTTDGLSLYLNIIAILIVLTALVALANGLISFLPEIGGAPLTLERVAGWIFAPIAWCMGIEWAEAGQVGALLGIKSILNEFIAYIQLSAMPREALSDRSRLITSYALCGFANLASIGIQISGIGTMAPERRSDLVDLAWPAFLAATLASCMNASVVAIVAG
ncbi:MAG: nucleoside:proton symporter [Betaproteobacteria bacterium]|nr:nucleoside:proton symporter [Betaproteobacteria bacterium]